MASSHRSEYETYVITNFYENLTSTQSPRCDRHVSKILPNHYAKDLCNLYQQHQLLLEIDVKVCGICTLKTLRENFLKCIEEKMDILNIIRRVDPEYESDHNDQEGEQESNVESHSVPEGEGDSDDGWISA